MNDLTNPSTNDETTLPFFPSIMIQHWPNQLSLLFLVLIRFDAHLYFAYSPYQNQKHTLMTLFLLFLIFLYRNRVPQDRIGFPTRADCPRKVILSDLSLELTFSNAQTDHKGTTRKYYDATIHLNHGRSDLLWYHSLASY